MAGLALLIVLCVRESVFFSSLRISANKYPFADRHGSRVSILTRQKLRNVAIDRTEEY